jgi:integrase
MGVLNLELKKGIWFARIVVPERLRERLGCRVMRRSLGTSDKQAAISLKDPILLEFRQRLLEAEQAVEAASVPVAAEAPATPAPPFIPWLERKIALNQMRAAYSRVETARLEKQWWARVAAVVASEPAAKPAVVTFGDAAKQCIEAKRAGWRRDLWAKPLAKHVYPVIGSKAVSAVNVDDVLKVLGPIWEETPVMAAKVRSYVAQVLSYAKARKWREGDNPAEWSDNLAHLLPATSQISEVKHHASLPWQQMCQFMAVLRSREGTPFRALEFLILTSARSDEVLGAVWSEIDLEGRTWSRPSERMKEGRAHRVPLCDRAMAILRMMKGKHGTFVFPSKSHKRLGHNILRDALRKRMNVEDAMPHGFRASFRTWCADHGKNSELAEWSLAHVTGGAVEAAYRRSDALERRRVLMAEWADYCAGVS